MSNLPGLGFVVDFFATPGTRRRFGPWTTNADGLKVKGAAVDTVGRGHFFPASGELLARLSLQDVAGLQEVHSTLELRTTDRAANTPPDQWVVKGVTYEVAGVGGWLREGGADDFFVAALQRVVAA